MGNPSPGCTAEFKQRVVEPCRKSDTARPVGLGEAVRPDPDRGVDEDLCFVKRI